MLEFWATQTSAQVNTMQAAAKHLNRIIASLRLHTYVLLNKLTHAVLPSSNRQHQPSRNEQTHNQVQQTWLERVAAGCQCAYHEGSDESPEIANGINQPDRCGRGGLA